MRGFGSWLARESVQTQSLDKASYDNQVLVLSENAENDVQKFVEMMQNRECKVKCVKSGIYTER